MADERPPHPGRTLLERFLRPLHITPYGLAKGMGVHVSRVMEIIKGRRGITADTAIRLGLFFGVPGRWFLEMQALYDTQGAPRVEELRSVVHPMDEANALVTPIGAVLAEARSSVQVAPETVRVPADLLARLQAQAALRGPRPARVVEEVAYSDGTPALAGRR